jgi:Ribbon-helix-helix protein, copG family
MLSSQEEKRLKRTHLYLTEKPMERLHQRAEKEGLARAELLRRAIDAFLAWNDPASAPNPSRPKGKGHSSPA